MLKIFLILCIIPSIICGAAQNAKVTRKTYNIADDMHHNAVCGSHPADIAGCAASIGQVARYEQKMADGTTVVVVTGINYSGYNILPRAAQLNGHYEFEKNLDGAYWLEQLRGQYKRQATYKLWCCVCRPTDDEDEAYANFKRIE